MIARGHKIILSNSDMEATSAFLKEKNYLIPKSYKVNSDGFQSVKLEMNKSDVIKEVITLPEKFSTSNKPIYSLLKDTGYFECFSEIKLKDIFNALIQAPQLADIWLQFSEDKRTTSGWYILKEDEQNYLVDYYPKNEGQSAFFRGDFLEACAYFIKQEIESIRLK